MTMNEAGQPKNPDRLRELYNMARTALQLQEAGLLREMTPAETAKWKSVFPEAEMILGNFIITLASTKDKQK